MGKVRTGKWFVHSDDLCLDLPEPDGGCFEVTRGNEAVKGGAHELAGSYYSLLLPASSSV